MASLVEELLADEEVRALWDRRQTAGPSIRFHQGRDSLQLDHSVHGLLQVTPLVVTPEAVAHAGMRLVMLLPEQVVGDYPVAECAITGPDRPG